MKTRITLIFALMVGLALSAGHDTRITKRNSGDTGFVENVVADPGVDSLLKWTESSNSWESIAISAIGQLGSNETITGTWTFTPMVTLTGGVTLGGEIQSTGNVVMQLGDNAGVNKLSIQDSDSAEVFAVDSNGDTTVSAVNTGTIEFEGATVDANDTTLTVVNPTAVRTITLPDVTGTVITTGDTGTVTAAMVATALKTESVTFTILEPDLVQPVTDEVLLKFFAAEKYPSGVTMVSWHVAASGVMTDTFNLLESATPDAGTPSTMESITLTAAATGEDNGAFDDGAVAADGYVFLDFNATVPDNVAMLSVTLTYTIN